MLGIVEVITLLLGLSGFGLTPNPKPATSDQALYYAIPEADIVAHLDIASVVPGNYKNLAALPKHPQIKASPELSKIVGKLVAEVEGARGAAKAATGIDITTDLTDATAFVSFVPGAKDPAFVVVVRGKLDVGMIDKIAGMSGKPATAVGAGKMIDMGTKEPSIGILNGVLLAGTPRLIKERLNPGWKAPQKTGGASLAYAAQTIDGKPVASISVALSNVARQAIVKELGPKKNLVTDLAQRHKSWSFSVFHDGVGWSWVDSNKAGLEQVAAMSEGWVDLMRASQIAPRGIAKILLAAIDSYKGVDRQVDEVIKRKADIWKIVETYTGDGNFKVAVNKDPTKNRLDVRCTGKTLSEVLPAGLVAPGMAFMLFGVRSAGPMSTPAVQPTQAVPPSRPVRKECIDNPLAKGC